jgi:hypothetical protein
MYIMPCCITLMKIWIVPRNSLTGNSQSAPSPSVRHRCSPVPRCTTCMCTCTKVWNIGYISHVSPLSDKHIHIARHARICSPPHLFWQLFFKESCVNSVSAHGQWALSKGGFCSFFPLSRAHWLFSVSVHCSKSIFGFSCPRSIPYLQLLLQRGFFLFFFPLGWGDTVHVLRRPLIGLLYQPRMIDDDESGAVCGMRIGRGSWSTQRKPAPVHFVYHKSHMTWPGLEPEPPRWEAGD